MAVMTRVLSRAFLIESDLPGPVGRCFVRTEEELWARLSELGPGVSLRTKRAFGCAGRGHRTLRERLIKDDRTFLLDGLRAGGLAIESELHIKGEFSIHGVIKATGETLLGKPCRCTMDAYHQPLTIERVEEESLLTQQATALGVHAAQELFSAGYFGPFGLDLLDADKNGGFDGGNILASDLNARFTLGWSTGMAELREQALQWVLSARER